MLEILMEEYAESFGSRKQDVMRLLQSVSDDEVPIVFVWHKNLRNFLAALRTHPRILAIEAHFDVPGEIYHLASIVTPIPSSNRMMNVMGPLLGMGGSLWVTN